ncbi:MAG: hypothetical protein HEQ13_19140 [Dolichospermum sp. DEX189]|jgi:hypothetical protein|nr:hypothetical protein [Dolichospermum sp. DEX189]
MLLLTWKTYYSISSLPSDIWNTNISSKEFGLDERFMKVVEKIHSSDKFYYCLAFNEKNKIVGIAFFYTTLYDLIRNSDEQFKHIFSIVRKLYPSFFKLPIGMIATFETYGRHFWYNSEVLTYEEFVGSFLVHIAKEDKNFKIIVLRDYIDTSLSAEKNIQNELSVNQNFGFINVETFPIVKVLFRPNLKPDEYIYDLKAKNRSYINKIIRERVSAGLTVHIIEDYLPFLEDIYNLYLNVNNNAKEFRTDCLPKDFFLEIKQQFGEDAKIIAIKDSEEKIIAFTLLLDCQYVMIPYLIGLDYTCNRTFNLWYHCVWESIIYSAKCGKQIVDLGVTNYSMKRKLGATLFPMNISIRIRNNVLNQIFKPILPMLAK